MRVENEKAKLCKELNAESQGRIKELSTLLELFSPTKTASE